MSVTAVEPSDKGLRLAAIVAVLVAGVLTGAQLGKLAPLIPWYSGSFGLSLVAAGWLAAILGIFIAAVALPAGWVIDRIGLFRSILFGVIALFAGGIALSLAATPASAFAARILEAAGYLLLCIALPAVLNEIALPRWKGPVLAIWSGFVPLGFATADFLAEAMLPNRAEATYLLTMTLLFGGVAAAALLLLRAFPASATEGDTGGFACTLSPGVILLSASFGAYVVLSLAMFTFMPTFIADAGAHYLVSAGMIALSVPLGNVAASVLVRGRGARYMAALAIFGFLVSAATALPAFLLESAVLATASVLALAVAGALVASAQFAAIPFITPAKGSVSVAIGLVCQAGGLGTVFGPPIAAGVIEAAGWTGFAWFLAGTALIGAGCMVPLLGRAYR